MARLSRKHKSTISKVINRWAESYSAARLANPDRIRELINVAYSTKTTQIRIKNPRARNHWKTVKLPPPTVHFLKSPIAFVIAQAVVRGRVSKKDAEILCHIYGIDKSFVAPLRRDKMINSFGHHHYHRGTSSLLDLWNATLEPPNNMAQLAAFEEPERVEQGEPPSSTEKQRQQACKRFPELAIERPGFSRNSQLRSLQNNHIGTITNWQYRTFERHQGRVLGNFACASPTDSTVSALADVPRSSSAVSASLIRCDLAAPSRWGTSYFEAEIICELMGIKDMQQRWAYELMHEAHAVMMFERTVIVLAERPTIHMNSAGELHNDEGPAVHWADGARQYWLDGHALGVLGEYIVDKPEELTAEMINREDNEEIKRLAIDKFGWGRYLEGVGARVIDRRENAVDNTIEALVSIRTKIFRRNWGWGSTPQETALEQRKLILSCRSTARQYFLAVPETIRTCEEGQRWMVNGASNPMVAALNRDVNVIGAS